MSELYPAEAPPLERLAWLRSKRKNARRRFIAWQRRYTDLDHRYRRLRAELTPLGPSEETPEYEYPEGD